VSYAETAELINLPYGLWTGVGWRKHEFNCIRQVAPVYTVSMKFTRLHQCARRHSAMSCANNDWTDRFAVWFVDSGGRSKHKFSHVRQVVPMCSHGKAHWRHLANMIELPSAASMRSYVRLLDHLFYTLNWLIIIRYLKKLQAIVVPVQEWVLWLCSWWGRGEFWLC